MDLIYQIVQVLKEDLERLAVSVQDTGLMEPVEPQDEGQLSYITSHKPYTKYIYILMYLRIKCTSVLEY